MKFIFSKEPNTNFKKLKILRKFRDVTLIISLFFVILFSFIRRFQGDIHDSQSCFVRICRPSNNDQG